MTERYVDKDNGNNAWDGLAPNFVSGTNGPKAGLNAAEDTPVVGGDLVHVRPSVTAYRETLTVDVSGTAGNAIEYRGDYAGLIWPNPTGMPVRITGSDNDTTATRANCITATSRNYRTFTGFSFDLSSSTLVNLTTCTDWVVSCCTLAQQGSVCFGCAGLTQARVTIQQCFFWASRPTSAIIFSHSAVVDNASHIVQNCIFIGPAGTSIIASTRVGGITVRNCLLAYGSVGVRVDTALTVGQTVTVNNCLLQNCTTGLQGTVIGEIAEDYNAFFGNTTNRTNTATGANSNAFPALFDPRWFFQLAYAGAGPNSPFQVVSPFDLASYSALLNVAGTSPPATDLRGTAVQGAQREWGALEHDDALKLTGSRTRPGFQIGM